MLNHKFIFFIFYLSYSCKQNNENNINIIIDNYYYIQTYDINCNGQLTSIIELKNENIRDTVIFNINKKIFFEIKNEIKNFKCKSNNLELHKDLTIRIKNGKCIYFSKSDYENKFNIYLNKFDNQYNLKCSIQKNLIKKAKIIYDSNYKVIGYKYIKLAASRNNIIYDYNDEYIDQYLIIMNPKYENIDSCYINILKYITPCYYNP